jgi:hypothetical protein
LTHKVTNIKDEIVFVLGIDKIPSFQVAYWKRTATIYQSKKAGFYCEAGICTQSSFSNTEYRVREVYEIKASWSSSFGGIKKGDAISTDNPWTGESHIEK